MIGRDGREVFPHLQPDRETVQVADDSARTDVPGILLPLPNSVTDRELRDLVLIVMPVAQESSSFGWLDDAFST